MQRLNWYTRRLRAMAPDEAVWRLRGALRDTRDRYLLGLRTRWAARQVSADGDALRRPGYRVSDLPVGVWSTPDTGSAQKSWMEGLRTRADQITANRLDLFDLQAHHLGDPIDWNRDPKSGIAAPPSFAPFIDYRDFQKVGDCKFVWELNRHHQLVVLGRAYRATGDIRYAQAAVSQLEQWFDQCPYGIGMNWRSPLELAIRLINWVWTVDLLQPSGVLRPAFCERLLNVVYLHLWEVSRKYSRGSSANNHYIGEAAGVYIASCYFRRLKDAARWQTESRQALCNEILAQTFPDGVTREQAVGYQLFVLQFFLLAGLVGRRTGQDFPPEYWIRLHRMYQFIGALGEGGDGLPMLGDCDDGYVLDLDANPHDVRPWLAIGAAVFNDPELKAWAGHYCEAGHWLLGPEGQASFEALTALPEDRRLAARAFPESGYYFLQCGRSDKPDRISVVFDCGPLGFKSLAAHGHADALSFTLRAFGVDVLVDPGTFDYFTYPHWRDYFRSTHAHNTVVVDDVDQSVMLGSFLWGARAEARCLEWKPAERGGRVCGEHDGYRRLASPVVHRRTLELDGERRELIVQDEFDTGGRHDFAVCFHLAEHCRVARSEGNSFEIEVGPGRVTLQLDPCLEVVTYRGSESPIGGWVSRGYHHKAISTTFVGRCSQHGPLRLRTRIEIGQPAPQATDSQKQAAHVPEVEGQELRQAG